MNTKKFLIQIESDSATKWSCDEEVFRLALEREAKRLSTKATFGGEPAVTVILEESDPDL